MLTTAIDEQAGIKAFFYLAYRRAYDPKVQTRLFSLLNVVQLHAKKHGQINQPRNKYDADKYGKTNQRGEHQQGKVSHEQARVKRVSLKRFDVEFEHSNLLLQLAGNIQAG
jgi:hypothetical protein